MSVVISYWGFPVSEIELTCKQCLIQTITRDAYAFRRGNEDDRAFLYLEMSCVSFRDSGLSEQSSKELTLSAASTSSNTNGITQTF